MQFVRDRRVALRTDIDAGLGLALRLFAIGVVEADFEVVDRIGECGRRGQRRRELDAGEFVIDLRHLAIAGTIDRVAQEQRVRIRIVAARDQLRESIAPEREVERVQLRCRRELGVVLQTQFVAPGLGVADVRHHRGGPEIELVLPSESVDLVLALVVHAAHQRIEILRGAAGEGAIAIDLRADDVEAIVSAVVVAEVDLELVGGVFLIGLGIKHVQRAGPGVGRAVVERSHHAIAGQAAGAAQGLDAVGVERASGYARAPPIADRFPGFVQADLVFLDRGFGMRYTQGQTQAAICGLSHEAGVDPVAESIGVGGRTQRVVLAANADHGHALIVVERAHGLHVERARQTLAYESRIWRLVHRHAADQLGRVLVEFDTPVVARAHHFATVEQGRGEIGRQAAHADDLGAARDALRRETRQSCDRLGNADIGKLADIFSRHGLRDRGGIALHRNRALDTRADADHLDRIEFGRFFARAALARGRRVIAAFLRGRGWILRCLCLYGMRLHQDGGRERRAQQVALELQH